MHVSQRGLSGISWPPRLQADVRQVLADSSAAEDSYRSNATVDQAYLTPPDQIRTTQAADVLRLRTHLGLPPPDSPDPSAPAA
jgi:hypothetical protein